MEFVLVRHGQPAWFPDGTGEDRPSLTPLGQEQARRVAATLQHERIDALWCSPLRRARETAAPLADALGMEPHVQDFLEEVHSLPLTGKTAEEVREYYRLATRRPVSDWWAGYAGTEPLDGFITRVETGLELAMSQLGATSRLDAHERIWHGLDREARVVLVGHAGSLGAVLTYLLGLRQAPWPWRRFGLSHAGVARVKSFSAAGARTFGLKSFDDQTHLGPEQRSR